MKLTKAMLAGAILSALSAGTAFAGTWEKGQAPNQDRWQYSNGDGTYARDGWQWIDGDNDGTAEYYYFDSEGWMLSDTITPDGNRVNADGAWVIDGAVQTQQVNALPAAAAEDIAAPAGMGISGTYSYYSTWYAKTGNIDTSGAGKDLSFAGSVTITEVDSSTIHVVLGKFTYSPEGVVVLKKQGDTYVFDSYLGQDWGELYAKNYVPEVRFNGNSVEIAQKDFMYNIGDIISWRTYNR